MKTLVLALFSMVIVDRVAVAVGNRVITESEVELRIRLTALQNKEEPKLDLATRRIAVERLIDLRLVEREMEVGHYPRTKTAGNATDLERDLSLQADMLTFLSLRFRGADAEMETWLKAERKRTRIVYLDKDLAP